MTTLRESRRPDVWLPRAAASIGALMLLALAVTYWLTYEPAPQVGIEWRAGISEERRAALERRFLLVNPVRENDRLMYDLLDTSGENLRALVFEPDVADTDRVSRPRHELPFDVPYGQSWMWVAHRTPLLRIPGVVPAIAGAAVLLFAGGAAAEIRRRSGTARDFEARQRVP
jgi:hypothetical protein